MGGTPISSPNSSGDAFDPPSRVRFLRPEFSVLPEMLLKLKDFVQSTETFKLPPLDWPVGAPVVLCYGILGGLYHGDPKGGPWGTFRAILEGTFSATRISVMLYELLKLQDLKKLPNTCETPARVPLSSRH